MYFKCIYVFWLSGLGKLAFANIPIPNNISRRSNFVVCTNKNVKKKCFYYLTTKSFVKNNTVSVTFLFLFFCVGKTYYLAFNWFQGKTFSHPQILRQICATVFRISNTFFMYFE